MSNQTDTFEFFAPIELIKAKDGEQTIMKMKGVASTSTQDSDGEFLDPNGFQLDYFLNSGYMNWNHQTNKNPLAIIGKPTKAKIVKGKMNIECELFGKNPLAKDVYKLGEVLKSQGMNLGFSIEGKVIERDENDPRKVKKAKITGCAITPNPKNQDAVAEIVKGHVNDYEELSKSMSAFEDMSEEEQEKALAAASGSGQAISKESVDKDLKVLTNQPPKIKKKKLNKSELIEQLTEEYPSNSIEEVLQIADLVYDIQKSLDADRDKEKTIEKSIEMNKVTPEAIEKAKQILDVADEEIAKGEEAPETPEEETPTEEPAEEPETPVEESETPSEEPAEESEEDLEKGATSDDDEDEDDDEAKKAMNKPDGDGPGQGDYFMHKGNKYMHKGGDSYTYKGKTYKMVGGKMEEQVEKKEIKKGLDFDTDSFQDDLVKGITSIMETQFDAREKAMNEKFKALGTINKGLEDQISDLTSRLESVENTPNASKSVRTTSYVKRDYETPDMMKGEGADDGTRVVSVTEHKKQLMNWLDEKSGISKGEISDQGLAKEVCAYEGSGVVGNKIKELCANNNIKLVQ